MNKLFYCLYGLLLLSHTSHGQSLWTPNDTNATIIENTSMVNGDTRFFDLFHHPFKKNKWWAVSPEAGLFVSNDAGIHFTLCKGSNLLPATALSSVAVDPFNDRIIYLGTGDASKWIQGKGLWKSFNGGDTFVKLSLPDCIITGIDISPTNRLLLIIATSQGIYRSTNGGVTFSLIATTNGIAFTDLKRNRGVSSHVLYACGFSDFIFSINDGASWTTNTTGFIFNSVNNFGFGGRIALSYADTNLVYALFAANNGSVFLSLDRGLQFTPIKTAANPNLLAQYNDSLLSNTGNYALSIATGGLMNSIFIGAENIFCSTDSGHSFYQFTHYKNNIPGGIHEIDDSNADTMRIATDGGVYYSTNKGVSFNAANFASGFFNCSSGSISPTVKNCFVFNTPDQGEFMFQNQQYKNIRNPPFNASCKFSYNKNQVIYYLSTGKSFNISTMQETQLIIGESNFDAIGFSEKDSCTAVISTSSGIYRFDINSSIATLIFPSSSSFKEIITEDSSLYALNDNHELIYTSNFYSNPCTFISRSFPGSSNTYHALKCASNELLLTCADSVFISNNQGVSWQVFNNGLPIGIEWNSVIQDVFTPGLFFIAGGSNGVYYRKPNSGHWLPYNASLPSRIQISSMDLFSSPEKDATLYLFYKGIGVYRSAFDSLRSVKASFQSSEQHVCRTKAIHFNSTSCGAVNGQHWIFPGGTPATSTAINPIVVYDSLGIFDLFLIANGTTTSDTLLIRNYISTLTDSTLPTESFENENTLIDSIINGGDPYYIWKKINTDSLHQNCMVFENFLHNEQGGKDIMQSKRIKLPEHRAAQLLLDIAYATYDSLSKDTLELQISTDCGSSYQTIYCRSGNTLATCPLQQSYFSPESSQWRTDTISLSSYGGSESIIFRINNIGHYGNNIYIDNIRIDTNFIQSNFEYRIKVFLQGLYEGNKKMRPVLFNLGISDDPTACDSIRIEMISANNLFHQNCILNNVGEAKIIIPIRFAETPSYIKVSARNAIPIYSKEMIVPKKVGYNLYDFSATGNP